MVKKFSEFLQEARSNGAPSNLAQIEKEGRAAAEEFERTGEGDPKNPYPAGSPEHAAFARGWEGEVESL